MAVNSEVDLKIRFKRWLEACVVVSLILHSSVFLAFKQFETQKIDIQKNEIVLEVEDIPQTEQMEKPPAPTRPSIPVESEDEDIPEDLTIEDTEVDFEEIPAAPAAPKIQEDEIPPFLPLEDQPQPIGGADAIRKLIKYPEMAQRAGIEGMVRVKALIGKTGLVEEVVVTRDPSNNILSEPVVRAIRQVKFRPAKQRNKPVKFWYAFSFRFKFNN